MNTATLSQKSFCPADTLEAPFLPTPGGELAVLHRQVDVVLHGVFLRHDVEACRRPLVGDGEAALARLAHDQVIASGLVGRFPLVGRLATLRRDAGGGPYGRAIHRDPAVHLAGESVAL